MSSRPRRRARAAEPLSPDRFLERDGVRLRYRDEGRGIPLVLVHGWALDLEMWEPQVAGLSDRCRIVRMDRRGFGLSGGTPDPEADVGDHLALLDRLGLERVALLGMSQGARAALALAGSAPERVACLILHGAPPDVHRLRPKASGEIPLARYRRLLLDAGIEAVRREIAAHPLMRGHAARTRRLLDEMLSRYRGADLAALAAHATPTGAPPCERPRCPVLVLGGELDSPRRRRAVTELCALLGGAERTVVPRAGHLANLDNPDDYNAAVAAFLARHSADLPAS